MASTGAPCLACGWRPTRQGASSPHTTHTHAPHLPTPACKALCKTTVPEVTARSLARCPCSCCVATASCVRACAVAHGPCLTACVRACLREVGVGSTTATNFGGTVSHRLFVTVRRHRLAGSLCACTHGDRRRQTAVSVGSAQQPPPAPSRLAGHSALVHHSRTPTKAQHRKQERER